MMKTDNSHRVICFGETLWDVFPSGKKPGGAPMNVAYHLNRLGISTAVIGKVGRDILGHDLLKWMEGRQIPISLIQEDETLKTGKVIAYIHDQEVSYDILKPVAWDEIAFEDEAFNQVRNAEYFIFGSLAARSTISRKTLYRLLKTSARKVFDVNLRPPHLNPKRIEFLLEASDIVKLNDEELNLISTWYEEDQDLKGQLKNLQNRFGIEIIITTRGEKGAVVLNRDEWLEIPAFKVKVRDTVGSGDAFLAGFIYQSLLNKDIRESISFASALGALVAAHEGACPDYTVQNILNIQEHGRMDSEKQDV